MDRAKPERYLPPALLTVLPMPVFLVVAPLAVQLWSWTDSRVPLILVPLAVVAAYAWCIPRTRRSI
ncbi:MAG TPA: hypothetical protein VMF30_06825 [Pirellulales bacterium]|nr:hypothetical protein [Pirellulales bacterium]